MAQKVLLASQNFGKIKEFQALFKPYPEIEIFPASEVVYNMEAMDHLEQYDSYLENALAKGRAIHRASHYPTLADDSGLEVMALHGEPGVHSKRYAKNVKGGSQEEANIQWLLETMRSQTTRKAQFVCTLVFVARGISIEASGTLFGTLTESQVGTGGFGYDSVFIPNHYTKTLAQLSLEEKNKISHRAIAVSNLILKLKEYRLDWVKG